MFKLFFYRRREPEKFVKNTTNGNAVGNLQHIKQNIAHLNGIDQFFFLGTKFSIYLDLWSRVINNGNSSRVRIEVQN